MSEPSGNRKNVVVLGAGMIGTAIAQDLAAQDALQIHVADSRQENLDRVQGRAPVRTHHVNLSDPAVLQELVKGADLAIGALPSVIGLQAVKACLEAGCNIVDISFMPEDARALDPVAKKHRAIAVTDCGVAPGLTNMVAAHAVSRFDSCEGIEMAVGGLPAVRQWPFNYKAGFAPWDVLEIYTRPAVVVENGKTVIREAMSGLELIDVPGVGTLESFISDGLRSLADTLKVPNMVERTLRWPGHVELMRVFRETGFFSLDPIQVNGHALRPRDVTAALLFPKWTFEEGEADLTVMQLKAWGVKQGERRTYTLDFLDRYDPATGLRSMSRSTGFTATAVANLILDGTLSEPGVFAPEALGAKAGLLDRVLEYLRERGIRCHIAEGVEPRLP
jgi:saccharopine dehydrogenase-like NADP-dependent oxidoreductase